VLESHYEEIEYRWHWRCNCNWHAFAWFCSPVDGYDGSGARYLPISHSSDNDDLFSSLRSLYRFSDRIDLVGLEFEQEMSVT